MQDDTFRLISIVAPKHIAIEAARRLAIRSVPQAVPIQPARVTGSRVCYANVRAQVESQGGAIVYGWSVTYFPRVLIQCIHHAVWRAPTGKLFDITPDTRAARIGMFLQGVDVRTEQVTQVDAVFPLTDDPAVLEYVAARERPAEWEPDEYGLPRPRIPTHIGERFARSVLSAWPADALCVCGKQKVLKRCCQRKVKAWLGSHDT